MGGSRPMGGGGGMGGSRPPPFAGSQVPMGSMGMQPGSMQIQPPPMGMPPPPMGMPPPMPMGSMGMAPPPQQQQMTSMGLPPMQTANTLQMNSMGMPPNRGGGGGNGGSMAGGRARSRTDAVGNGPPMRLDMMMSAPMRQRSPSPQRRAGPMSMGMMPSRAPSMSGGRDDRGWDNEDNMTEYEDYDDDQNNYVALPDARGGGGNGGGGMMGNSMPMGGREGGQDSYVALPVDQQPNGGRGVVNAIQNAVQQSRQRMGNNSGGGGWN
jgi:hypothetical protein